jgi:hypothetical protein
MKLEFPQHIFKKDSNFMKICTLEAALFHVDRWLDMPKPMATFHNSEDSIKNMHK